MHGFTEEDLILYLYKEISVEQSMLIEDALANDWALKEKFEVMSAAFNDLKKLSLSPRKSAVERVLQYASSSTQKLPSSV
jgi:hypothetical protein